MKTSDFYYDLPQELIAQTPIKDRDQSRLLVFNKTKNTIEHRHFFDILEYLQPGDCLVLNDSRVIPARLIGTKVGGSATCEILLLTDKGDNIWECLVKPGKRLQVGAKVSFGDGVMIGEIIKVLDDGNRLVRFIYEGIFLEVLEVLGRMPLPPYIKAELKDQERYQTVYSKNLGSAAAPTAGLHFTKKLLAKIEEKGINIAFVTLHVGLGTFRPVKEENIQEHDMHSEFCMIDQNNADIINQCKRNGHRIICVGTTSCRTLESFASSEGLIQAKSGWTNIFIYPGYTFKIMDALITNFHLPESTLIMLVAAFTSRQNILSVYKEAVEEKYRFFSFGDAMFIY